MYILYIGIITIIIGYIGYLTFQNLIMMLISLELILLGIGSLFLYYSFLMDDINGLILTLLILPLAGAESALALTLLVKYAPATFSC